MPSTVSIREVNQNTSAVFQRVWDGDELIVTKGGQPLARVIPFRPRDGFERLVVEGRIIPAETGPLPPVVALRAGLGVDELIALDRAERDVP